MREEIRNAEAKGTLEKVPLSGVSSRAAKAAQAVARFILPRLTVRDRPHPTSGLPGFPAQDYMAAGGSTVHAPFDGRVPIFRPIGWAKTQDPENGLGGQRIYLQRRLFSHTAYVAHLGALTLKRGQRFKQGDEVGPIWRWPGDPGRSHTHLGYQGGDPLDTLVRADGSFVIDEHAPKAASPIPRIGRRDRKWVVTLGEKVIYRGGLRKARQVLARRRRARRIDEFFRTTQWIGGESPLVGAGMEMVRAADAAGLEDGERLMAAIAACETSAGTQGDGRHRFNYYGILSHGEHRAFRARKEGIVYLAELLADRYVAEGRHTIEAIGAKYAPVGASNDPHDKNSRWVGCVSRRYDQLGGTRYLSDELIDE